MKTPVFLRLVALGSTIAVQSAALASTPPAVHVRGTVSAINGNRVTVATNKGPVVVNFTAKTRFAGVIPASVADIDPGTFIGTANVPGSGSAARALEVVLFPKAMAGTDEGDYAWDLPGGGNAESAMTNGTVATPKTSMMTNATVSHVLGGPIKTVALTYKGGTKNVAIPPGAPVVRIVPASKGLLVVGAHVVVFPPTSAASTIVIGEKGAIPPM